MKNSVSKICGKLGYSATLLLGTGGWKNCVNGKQLVSCSKSLCGWELKCLWGSTGSEAWASFSLCWLVKLTIE